MANTFGPPPSKSTQNPFIPPSLETAEPVVPNASLQPAGLSRFPKRPTTPAKPVVPAVSAPPGGQSRFPKRVVSPPELIVPPLSTPAPKSKFDRPPVAPTQHAPGLQQKLGTNEALAEMASLAQTLNAETDDLNDIIQTINGKLRAFNFGIEVWCKGSGDVDFGFARLGQPSEWQLVARSSAGDFGDGRREYWSDPLLKRNRNERVEGLEIVPEILRELKREAEQKVGAIRRAKELAASL